MDVEGEGNEGPREEETMVGKEGSVLMGFYLGGQDTAHGPGQAHCPRGASLVAQLVRKSASNVGDLGSIPGLGRSPGEGNGNPLQYNDSPLAWIISWTEEPGRLQCMAL